MSAVLHPASAPNARVDLSTRSAARAVLRSFWRMASSWKLSTTEQTTLLGVALTTLYRWRRGRVGPLARHVLERLSYLFGIYFALQVLLPVPARADAWIRQPNAAPFLGGRSALERMMCGQLADLYVVRQYLYAERGAHG